MKISWSLQDLVVGRDGKLVLTKLQAATFHALLAATVAATTFVRLYKFYKGDASDFPNLFDGTMWGVYGLAAVGHAVIDKTTTQVSAFKNRQLDAEAGSSSETVVSETTVTKVAAPPAATS